MPSIQFLGAAGTVTGSRHLVEHNGARILMDCGLFQGRKDIRKRNWDPFPVPARDIDAVVLSHAHIDHTGWLPRLRREGFRGPVYSTPATRDLLAILLPDSGRIHEADARYANRKGFSKHKPALPLYTEEDAVSCIGIIRAITYDQPHQIAEGVTLTFHRAGHILGSAFVQLDLDGDGEPHRIVFSGDLGRPHTPIIRDAEHFERATTLLVECTYGDRLHAEQHPLEDLRDAVIEATAKRGVLVIPAFAIGRTQHMLYYLVELQEAGAIGELPIFVDSPMAIDATPLYLMHREEHDVEMSQALIDGDKPIYPKHVKFTRSVAESKAINERGGPMIIISASGMATGGRVLHHLKRRLPDPNTTVLFVGYQAVGTRGRKMLEGATTCRIHGENVPVNARVGQIYGFSAHADYGEVDEWLSSVKTPPKMTYCVHGEPDALEATRARLEGRGWPARVPDYLERVEL